MTIKNCENTYFYIHDHLGSTSMVLDADGNGEDVVICDGEEHFLYEPQTSNLYDGNNVVIKNSVAVFNDMYSTKSGSKVLNALISSPTEYKIKSTGDA